MQKVEPRLIRKINTSGGPIRLMENLAVFTAACHQLGVQHYDLFQSIDLWDNRDIGTGTPGRSSVQDKLKLNVVNFRFCF